MSYTYDLAGRLLTSSKIPVAGDPGTGTFTNFYDTAGRFYKEQYPDGKSFTHELDANGNVTKTTWSDGYYVQNSYDQLNRLTGTKLNGAVANAATYSWDALSRLSSKTYENGASVAFGYALDDAIPISITRSSVQALTSITDITPTTKLLLSKSVTLSLCRALSQAVPPCMVPRVR